MKKIASIVLVLALLLSTVSALCEALPAEADTALPQVGDVVYGFEVLEIREYSLIGADLVLFDPDTVEHGRFFRSERPGMT